MSRKKIPESFSAGQAIRLSGASYGNVDYWARGGMLVPSIAQAKGVGSDRRYSFPDVVALFALNFLRDDVCGDLLHRTISTIQAVTPADGVPLGLFVVGFRQEVQLARTRAELLRLFSRDKAPLSLFVFDLAGAIRLIRGRIENARQKAA